MSASNENRNQSEEDVQIDHLSRRLGRYNLVVAVAKRSRDIEERVDSVIVPSSGILIRRALKDISDGKVKIFQPVEEKPEPEETKKPKKAVRAKKAAAKEDED